MSDCVIIAFGTLTSQPATIKVSGVTYDIIIPLLTVTQSNWAGNTEIFIPLPIFTVTLSVNPNGPITPDSYLISFPEFLTRLHRPNELTETSISGTTRRGTNPGVELTLGTSPTVIRGVPVVNSHTLIMDINSDISPSLRKGDKIIIIIGQELPLSQFNVGNLRMTATIQRSKSQSTN